MAPNHILSSSFLSSTSTQPPTCSVCHKTFACMQNLEVHLMKHIGMRSFACSKCEKVFTHQSSLEDHIASVHLHLKPFVCSLCFAKFSRKVRVFFVFYIRHDEKDIWRVRLRVTREFLIIGETSFLIQPNFSVWSQKSTLCLHKHQITIPGSSQGTLAKSQR